MKMPPIDGGISGETCFGFSSAHRAGFHAQGTVASPARLPDLANFQITPDALQPHSLRNSTLGQGGAVSRRHI